MGQQTQRSLQSFRRFSPWTSAGSSWEKLGEGETTEKSPSQWFRCEGDDWPLLGEGSKHKSAFLLPSFLWRKSLPGWSSKSSLLCTSIASGGKVEAKLVCSWRRDRRQSLRNRAEIYCCWRKVRSKNPWLLGGLLESSLGPESYIYNK